ncbi:MAG: glycosyltransferase family 4 protein [Chitinivibrionales bacterium]
MNILYISNEYPPETGYGGIGTYTMHIAEGMAARGHSVHVLCRSQSTEAFTVKQHGVVVHRTPPGVYPLPSQRMYYPLRKLCYAAIPHSLFRLAWARQVYGAYKDLTASKEKFDIIEYPECGGEGYYFSHERRVPRVIRLHTPWEMVRGLDSIHESLFDRGLLGHIERNAARCATAITSPSSALAKELKSRWNLKKITIFPNPLPFDNSTMTSGNDWIYTGRIEYRKGVHILIEAYARLCQSQTPPMLRIIGKPYGKLPNGVEYSDYIAQLITRKGCDRKIEWIRGMPLASIPGFLQRSNVAIFPSLWENLSYSCLEAMANGLTVIASRCGGFPEIINNGENGLLFEPENISQLTDILSMLLHNPVLGRNLGISARKSIETVYNSSIVCKDAEFFYGNVIKGGLRE